MNEDTKIKLRQWLEPRYALIALGILVFGAVVIVSIIRDRIVNDSQDQVSITGQGKVSYQPDMATVTLGVQVDRAPTADAALAQLNEKVNKIVEALSVLSIKKEDIQTRAYVLNPQYDFKDNVSSVGGYGANQQLAIKVVDIINNPDLVSQVVATAGSATANQVIGIDFTVSNMNDFKQQARILAIADAKSKAAPLAKAAGVKLGKVANWYENEVQSPESPIANMGFGGSDVASSKIAPQVPAGTREIIVEIGLTYDVR